MDQKSKKASTQNELIFGAHAILEVLKAKKRKIISIYTTKIPPKIWPAIQQRLTKGLTNIQYVDRAILDRMADTRDHNGILAWVTPFKFQSKPFNPEKKRFVLMLDAIQDVRNIGAILRSAYCTGVDGIVLCKTNTAPLTGAAFKASAGLAEHMDIYLAPSIKHAILEHKSAGYSFYMAVLDGKDATSINYKQPLCLVIGNEATGISKDIQTLGEKITLAQRSPDISYNASVAAGILLFLISSKTKILAG